MFDHPLFSHTKREKFSMKTISYEEYYRTQKECCQEYIKKAKQCMRFQQKDRAIYELEKANTICEGNEEVIRLLVSVHIQSGEIGKAIDIVEKNHTLLKESVYEKMIHSIRSKADFETYQSLLEEAREYRINDDFENSILKYKISIQFMPLRVEAYEEIVEVYELLHKYDDAIDIVNEGIMTNASKRMKDILREVMAAKNSYNMQRNLMSSIYDGLIREDYNKVKSLLLSKQFKNNFINGIEYQYSMDEQQFVEYVSEGKGCILSNDNTIYAGDLSKGIKQGKGIRFRLNSTRLGYDVYIGEWKDNKANGYGTYITMFNMLLGDNLEEYIVYITGGYKDNHEQGKMSRTLYDEYGQNGVASYQAIDGIPQSVGGHVINGITDEHESYTIGKIVTKNQSYPMIYHKGKDTLWGI